MERANLDPRRDEASLNAFKAALCERFSSNNIHIDIFGRLRPNFDGEDCELVQIAIYREGLLDDFLAFDDVGALVRRARRPVFEAAMTYEPATGVIEIVANDRESREEVVRIMARDLLRIEFQSERVPFRVANAAAIQFYLRVRFMVLSPSSSFAAAGRGPAPSNER